ncbi:uncharacterized protein SCHCODRAFT_02643353 [Schizophyllum commune H4-8]|uniref:uncharacterized protein n=1 Tax=Schizophyllum commune (strain H4-8 / FGSC 9210) TaxID=578458 RepID=UPI00215F2EBD|nr:uncharacterized protein SCHCODRAFT_02643353 [Schizophyllum commune H4-8]KAI5886147.1 hypothetical protein SCHCODRAFT_02643353 [Schizophyllum commune H4-8]
MLYTKPLLSPPVLHRTNLPDKFTRIPSRRTHARVPWADIYDNLGSGGATGEY